MKGYKTILFGLVMIVGPAALNYLGGIDWTSLGISPGVSAMIGAVIIALRAMTTSGVFKASVLIAGLTALTFGLSACHLAAPLAGVAAGGGALASGLGAFDTAVTVVNDAEKAACAAQSGANAAGDLAIALGKTVLADKLAAASRIAGKACLW